MPKKKAGPDAQPLRKSGPDEVAPPRSLAELAAAIQGCRACPRLVKWREQVAVEKRSSFRDETYWGRPVAGFGDPHAAVLVLGLAPAAHGANRTGRVFTGDRSGDWLFRSMHRFGFANQSTSLHRDDGLVLTGAWVNAAVRCAPPDNAPTPQERDQCLPFLREELALLTYVRVIVVLGQFAYDVLCRELGVKPKPKFGHGTEAAATWIDLAGQQRDVTLLCSFHPSQQNTFTGRLTEPMLDAVFERAAALGSVPPRKR